MKYLWDMCKLLNNPRRLDLLVKVYSVKNDGLNVGLAVEGSGLQQPSTSAYLRQLEYIGLIRRQRSGRFVNYYANTKSARDDVSVVGDMIIERVRKDPKDRAFAAHFNVLMNAFRVRVLHYLWKGGNGTPVALCEKFDREMRLLVRDLKPILDSGLLAVGLDGTY